TEVDIEKLPKGAKVAAMAIYQNQVELATNKLAKTNVTQSVNAIAETVRASVVKAIDATVPPGLPNAEKLKKNMRDTIGDVKVVTSIDQGVTLGLDRDELAASFRSICGADGLSLNAFASEYQANGFASTIRYILICPGMTVAAAGSDTDSL